MAVRQANDTRRVLQYWLLYPGADHISGCGYAQSLAGILRQSWLDGTVKDNRALQKNIGA